MIVSEFLALMFVAILAWKITSLWDKNNRAEKEAARKLMRNGIYGHFENGRFIFDAERK